jgi:anti-sigma B factor antagonist
MVGIAVPGIDTLPPGRHRDLVEALHQLYRQAGMPSTRILSAKSRAGDDLPDTVSHELVSATLRGAKVPSWFKLETLVRILVALAVGHPDTEATLARFHQLWLAAAGASYEVKLPSEPEEHRETDPALDVSDNNGVTIVMGLDVKEDNGVTIVTVRGEVDIYTAPRLRELLVKLAGDGHYRIVVDLEGVDFLDSAGLGVLVGGLRRLRNQRGDLLLVCTQHRILKVFEITGLTRVFSIFDSVDAAVRAE